MNRVSDEMLMAYADGELDPATIAEIERAAADDPELRDRLARFHETRLLTREAYAGVLEEAVPERLIAAASARRKPRASRWRMLWLPVGALVLASVAGFLVAAALLPGDRGGVPDFRAFDGIAEVIARLPSGEAATLPLDGGSTTLMATGTYATADGYCRAFVVRPDSASATPWRGIECLHDGRWTVDMAIRDAGVGADVFAPASAGAIGAVDAFLDAAGADAPVEPEEERALIDGNWQGAGSG